MTEQEVLAALGIGEDADWEFKAAKDHLPGNLWETYSAMANTDGGTVVLGVKETGGRFEVQGLDDPRKARTQFWDLINNRNKVSANLLVNGDVRQQEVAGMECLVISVPRATRKQRPVYVGQNPIDGTYRRDFSGDYKCPPEVVGRMLADQADEPWDSRVLDRFGLEDLDTATVGRYRELFKAGKPGHTWLDLETPDFLRRIGATRKDRASGADGVTIAGLLMLGNDEAIRDPEAVPEFHLDFRERLSEDTSDKWSHRLVADGTWVCNVLQFHDRVLARLGQEWSASPPLQLSLFVPDTAAVHLAISEALANALVHADYRGQGGVVIERYRDRIELSNPGTLLLPVEWIYQGGTSECRNKTLQHMLMLAGLAERAGSGWDTIRKGWEAQSWRTPTIRETQQPDRVLVVLPMVSLIPDESLQRLQQRYGPAMSGLERDEVQALVTADLEGTVSNARLQQVSNQHPADLTKVLQGLVGRRMLVQEGQKRGTVYRLAAPGEPTIVWDDGLVRMVADVANEHGIGEAIIQRKRQVVLRLCDGRFLSAVRIGEWLRQDPRNLQARILTPMVNDGLLRYLHPSDANHPEQAYTTVDRGNDE